MTDLQAALAEAAEFERLQSAATRGPWHSFPSKLRVKFSARINQVLSHGGKPVVNWSGFDDSDVPYKQHKANAELIAASRSTTLPALVRDAVFDLQSAYQQLEYLWEQTGSCPCGARRESPNTHSHVAGCPTAAAVEFSKALAEIERLRGEQ